MAGLNETPKGDRVHIAFFGLRNAGKSTLVNRLTGQDVAIVSDVAGTTTDPVSKAMEILPLGPCLVTDTAGLDDEGPLGEMRVKKSLDVLATTDIAVWVDWDNGRLARCNTGTTGVSPVASSRTTQQSLGSARSGNQNQSRSSAMRGGRSFAEWIAKSTRPTRTASSKSRVKKSGALFSIGVTRSRSPGVSSVTTW